MPVIVVENLVRNYGEVRAVDSINFAVEQGEIFGLLGPNGAGKTTTIEILESLRNADRGQAMVLGLDVRKQPKEVKERIGIQLQATSLYPFLTVTEVIKLFGSFFRRSLPPKQLIDLLDLGEKAKTRTKDLSGGQRQRLSVALALVNDPEVVFLDEPTTGLDPQARRSLWEAILTLRGQGKTVLLTTHYMEEAEQLCDRVAIMDHGRVLALDGPQQLIRSHFRESALEFETEASVEELGLAHLPEVTSSVKEEGTITVYSRHIEETLPPLLRLSGSNGWRFANLRLRQATLEDVFLKLTGRRIRE